MSFHTDNNTDNTNGFHPVSLEDETGNKFSSEAFKLLSEKSENYSLTAKSNLPELSLVSLSTPSERTTPRLAELLKQLKADDPISYSQSGSVQVGTRNGVSVYVKDSSGEWESKDGKTWFLKGTDGKRVWHGEIGIKDGDYHYKNTDSGVSAVRKPDGTITRSIVDKTGLKIEVTTNAAGVPLRCVDATGTWTSADGKSWTNEKTGKTNNSTVRLDEFGQYHVGYDGKETVEARSQELSQILTRQERLTRAYGVVFPKPGEKVTSFEKELTLRPPTEKELDCLERVLERNKQMDMTGMRLSFVQGSSQTDKDGLWGVHRGAQNEILLYPRNNKQIDGWEGLEGTLQHELVHHEQYLNWGSGQWNSRAPEQARQLMREFGWNYDEASGKYRLLDNENKEWQYNKDTEKWDPVIAGNAESGARSISSTEMRDKAKVKPSTNYFNLPWEMHAEAQSMFRHDRHQLFEQSRELYNLMKSYDQREINRKFGTSADGQALRIRGAEGTLVPNTPANRRAVEQMERRFGETKAPPRSDMAMHRNCCSSCLAA